MLDKLRIMEKQKIKEMICMIVGVILVMLMIWNFRWIYNAHYQIHIETFYFKASSIFCLIILLMRRINYKNWRLYAGSIGYAGYAVFYLMTHNNDYGPEYREYLIWQFVLRLLMLIIILDSFSKKDITHLEKKNLIYSISVIVAVVFCTALYYNAMLHMLVPAIVLFITPISEEKWKRFLICFSCGYYITFVISMAQSFINNQHMYAFRYYFGNFESPYGAAAITMGGLISALYIFEMIRDKKNKFMTIVSVISIIFPCVMILIIGSRSVQLAAFVVVFLYFFMDNRNTEKERKIRKRTMLIVVACLAVIVLIAALILFNLDISGMEDKIELVGNEAVRNRLTYYVSRINWLRNTKSYGFVFADGDKINILDHLVSKRISIWYLFMQQVTMRGNTVLIPVGEYGPHSIYVYQLVKFGWIGGFLSIISYILGAITAGKRLNDNRRVYLIPFLWMIYYLVAGIGEMPFNEFDSAVFFMIFQYPLLFQLTKDKKD